MQERPRVRIWVLLEVLGIPAAGAGCRAVIHGVSPRAGFLPFSASSAWGIFLELPGWGPETFPWGGAGAVWGWRLSAVPLLGRRTELTLQ